jgi:hypothetical protein
MAQPGDEPLDGRARLGWSRSENGHGARRRSPIGNRVVSVRRRVSLAEPEREPGPPDPSGTGFHTHQEAEVRISPQALEAMGVPVRKPEETPAPVP